MSEAPNSSSRDPENLHAYLARDCLAMARYALGNGLNLPASVAQSLDALQGVVADFSGKNDGAP